MADLERVGEVALLRLRGGKANAMNAALFATLERGLEAFRMSDARALVLTGYDRYFSAGLALPEIADLDRPRMKVFIEAFNVAMERVFRCPRPVVAALNGHAIAGGCVLALQADWRLMAEGEGRIGLNEVQLGIGLPLVVIETLRLRVAPAALRPIALEGGLFSPHQAQELGLVDEVAPAAELESRALERARHLAAAPADGFAQVKAALGRPVLETLERSAAAENERWLDSWFSPAACARRSEMVERLTKTRQA